MRTGRPESASSKKVSILFYGTGARAVHIVALRPVVGAVQQSMLHPRRHVAVDIARLQETFVLVELRQQLIHVDLCV